MLIKLLFLHFRILSMAKICEICGRRHQMANTRSKSNIATRRRQKINLQNIKIDGITKRVCARCIRTKNKEVA